MFVKRLGLAIAIIMAIALLIFQDKPNNGKLSGIINYDLDGKKYRLLVAKTPAEREKGLMFYRKLDDADGMIFLFDDKNYRTFWNKNTLMNLNIYWIADNKIIGKDFLPSVEKSKNIVTVSSPKPVDKVVELSL